MALPINVEDLLRQRKVESNRIEFKKGCFETDEDRLSFLVCIPCHEVEEGVSFAFMTSEAKDKETNNHDKGNDKETTEETKENPKESGEITKETINNDIEGQNDSVNDSVNGSVNDRVSSLSPSTIRIFEEIKKDEYITYERLMTTLNLSLSTVARAFRDLKKYDIIKREGSDKTGKWIILK